MSVKVSSSQKANANMNFGNTLVGGPVNGIYNTENNNSNEAALGALRN
jgi:hypothetical protein